MDGPGRRFMYKNKQEDKQWKYDLNLTKCKIKRGLNSDSTPYIVIDDTVDGPRKSKAIQVLRVAFETSNTFLNWLKISIDTQLSD